MTKTTTPKPRKWAKCEECGGEVMFDAWVDVNGEVMQGPFDECRCSECDETNPFYEVVTTS